MDQLPVEPKEHRLGEPAAAADGSLPPCRRRAGSHSATGAEAVGRPPVCAAERFVGGADTVRHVSFLGPRTAGRDVPQFGIAVSASPFASRRTTTTDRSRSRRFVAISSMSSRSRSSLTRSSTGSGEAARRAARRTKSFRCMRTNRLTGCRSCVHHHFWTKASKQLYLSPSCSRSEAGRTELMRRPLMLRASNARSAP